MLFKDQTKEKRAKQSRKKEKKTPKKSKQPRMPRWEYRRSTCIALASKQTTITVYWSYKHKYFHLTCVCARPGSVCEKWVNLLFLNYIRCERTLIIEDTHRQIIEWSSESGNGYGAWIPTTFTVSSNDLTSGNSYSKAGPSGLVVTFVVLTFLPRKRKRKSLPRGL